MSETDYSPRLHSPQTGVVITGGASGIGLACANALAAVGRNVALWDIDGAQAEDVAHSIAQSANVRAIGIQIDLRDLSAYERAAAQSRETLGAIGGLVHAAGIVDTGSIEGLTEQSWADGINTHLRPLAMLSKLFLADFAKNKGSAIVGIASINATLGNGVNPIYSAAKGGILSLIRSLADRLAQDGIRINAVSPGMVLTPMLAPTVELLPPGHFERRILLERLGEPHEIGRVVRFLLSDEASYITASELVIDGGNISSQRG